MTRREIQRPNSAAAIKYSLSTLAEHEEEALDPVTRIGFESETAVPRPPGFDGDPVILSLLAADEDTEADGIIARQATVTSKWLVVVAAR